jgi:hypothetical protein
MTARQIHFEMDTSELDLTQSMISNTPQTAARLQPRPFDISWATTAAQDTPKIGNRQSNLGSTSAITINSLSSKLQLDQSTNAKLREEESRMRFEVEQSRALLIEQLQMKETQLTTELADCKASFERQMKEKEQQWAEKDAERVAEIQKLEQRANDIIEMSRKRLADKEKAAVEQLERQEEVWKQRLEDALQDHNDAIQALHDKHALEKNSRDLAEKARLATKEDQARTAFETKLKKYEAQMHEVMRNYHDKELIIHGSLDEARKEIVLMRNACAAKEDSLREELVLKNKSILTLQGKLHLIDDITKVADSWRGAARDLAKIVVNACVSIQDMPPLPVPPKDTTPNLLMGYGKEDESALRQKQAYAMEVKAYSRARREHVMVQKDLIGRALRNSKASPVAYFHHHTIAMLS